jgi:Holliday junction DNA helicase RuvA
MFYYLNGTITHIESGLAVVDCGGVGYAVHTSARTISQLNAGKPAKLLTHPIIREDTFDLYGFASQAELNTFRLLIGVSGVGARSALAILSASTPEDLALSIVGGDEKVLTRAPGVGKKLAQRIILELKDKLGKDMSDFVALGGEGAFSGAVIGSVAADVTAALTGLGYSAAEVGAAFRKLDPELLESGNVGEIVKAVLKRSVKQ